MSRQGLISQPGKMIDSLRLFVGVLLLLFGVSPATLLAATLYYPQGNLSLQDVVSEAESGDTIIVAPGTYHFFFENLRIVHEFLILKSFAGPSQTILQGTGKGPVVSFATGSKAVLDGFTLSSTKSSPLGHDLNGGGIYCAPESAPVIKNNVIKDNEAIFGAGIYCDKLSAPVIEGNHIWGNSARVAGGGIFSLRSSALITSNRFANNEAGNSGGAIAALRDTSRIYNNIIWKNRAGFGGGISCDRAATIISNNTIVENIADRGGGIVVDKGSVRLTNMIFWHNKVDDLFLKQVGPSARPSHSLIGDGTFRGMNGNIAEDPLFVNLKEGDFHLSAESPCVDAGDYDPYYEDIDGSVNDMGAYGGPDGILVIKNLKNLNQ